MPYPDSMQGFAAWERSQEHDRRCASEGDWSWFLCPGVPPDQKPHVFQAHKNWCHEDNAPGTRYYDCTCDQLGEWAL